MNIDQPIKYFQKSQETYHITYTQRPKFQMAYSPPYHHLKSIIITMIYYDKGLQERFLIFMVAPLFWQISHICHNMMKKIKNKTTSTLKETKADKTKTTENIDKIKL